MEKPYLSGVSPRVTKSKIKDREEMKRNRLFIAIRLPDLIANAVQILMQMLQPKNQTE